MEGTRGMQAMEGTPEMRATPVTPETREMPATPVTPETARATPVTPETGRKETDRLHSQATISQAPSLHAKCAQAPGPPSQLCRQNCGRAP